ncbi:MAG: hypothetical protein ACW990_17200, partial [Promethearchaeota archaeon]
MRYLYRKHVFSVTCILAFLLLIPTQVNAKEATDLGLNLLPLLFLLVNIGQSFIATIMVLEVKRISVSQVWNRIFFGNLALIGLTTSITILLIKMSFVKNPLVLYLIAFFFTFSVSMVILTIYLLIKPLMKGKKIELINRKYASVYILLIITLLLI